MNKLVFKLNAAFRRHAKIGEIKDHFLLFVGGKTSWKEELPRFCYKVIFGRVTWYIDPTGATSTG